ncbi:MAG TPA: S-layer protein, partial [Planctomycetaceae bacterium]|nr:S-layer protein [Planctomycetaceae bacterium]
REIPCECERAADVSLAQTLNLINGPTVSEAIIHPQGLIARLNAAKVDDKTLIEDLYLSVLNRFPSDDERTTATGYFLGVSARAEAAQDLMWALMNSPAFLFNR